MRAYFGLTPFGVNHFRQAVRGLAELALQTDKGVVLAGQALDNLRRQHIVIPSLDVVERVCAEAITHANRRIYRTLTELLSDDHLRRLDELLKPKPMRGTLGSRMSALLLGPISAGYDSFAMNASTRRVFLAQLAALGCSSNQPEPEPQTAAVSPWKLAIGLNGFGSSETHHDKTYDYDEILAFGRDEGFDGIELWRNWRGGYPDPEDDAAIQAQRQKIEEHGLQVFSIQAGVSGVNPISSDAAERADYTAKLNTYVDLAKKFGCDAMGLWAGGRPDDGAGEDQVIERLADVVKPVARYAIDQGMFLAIEGEPPLIINSVERYHKLFDAVGMDEFKVIFDPSHFDVLGGAQGRPEDLLLDLGVKRVGYIQFCDGDSTLRPFPDGRAGTSRHLPCGQGIYDIPKLCKILFDGGFEGWFQIDSWATEDPYETSKTCKAAVFEFLKGERMKA